MNKLPHATFPIAEELHDDKKKVSVFGDYKGAGKQLTGEGLGF